MLLIEPPLTFDEWAGRDLGDAAFQALFHDYCDRYVKTVLSLPRHQLLKIWWELSRGLGQCDVGPELLHVIVEREIKEREYEASGKVAKLVILSALVDVIAQQGVAVHAKTRSLLCQCGRLLPAVLMMAVHDHFGMLQVN